MTKFRESKIETAISEISTFELAAKAAKLIVSGKLESRDAVKGIQSIANDDLLLKLQSYTNENLDIAFKLRVAS